MENANNFGNDRLRLPQVPAFTVNVGEKFIINIRKGEIHL